MADDEIKKPCLPLPMFKCNADGDRVFCPRCARMWFLLFVVFAVLLAHKQGKLKLPSIASFGA